LRFNRQTFAVRNLHFRDPAKNFGSFAINKNEIPDSALGESAAFRLRACIWKVRVNLRSINLSHGADVFVRIDRTNCRHA